MLLHSPAGRGEEVIPHSPAGRGEEVISYSPAGRGEEVRGATLHQVVGVKR